MYLVVVLASQKQRVILKSEIKYLINSQSYILLGNYKDWAAHRRDIKYNEAFTESSQVNLV